MNGPRFRSCCNARTGKQSATTDTGLRISGMFLIAACTSATKMSVGWVAAGLGPPRAGWKRDLTIDLMARLSDLKSAAALALTARLTIRNAGVGVVETACCTERGALETTTMPLGIPLPSNSG